MPFVSDTFSRPFSRLKRGRPSSIERTIRERAGVRVRCVSPWSPLTLALSLTRRHKNLERTSQGEGTGGRKRFPRTKGGQKVPGTLSTPRPDRDGER